MTGWKEARTISMITHDHNLIVVLVSTGDDSHDILNEGKIGINARELPNGYTHTQIGVTFSSTSL